jgi:hypothetical protein
VELQRDGCYGRVAATNNTREPCPWAMLAGVDPAWRCHRLNFRMRFGALALG